MEPHNDGVTEYTKTAQAKTPTHKMQGDDGQMDDDGTKALSQRVYSKMVDVQTKDFLVARSSIEAADADEATADAAVVATAGEDEDLQLAIYPKPSPAAPAQESARQPTSALPQGRSSRTDHRAEQTNSQEQLEREQDKVRYRILLDAIRGQFQGTGSPNNPFNPKDTGTVEELTASQVRTVFDYIVSNNVLRDLLKHLEFPPRETTQVRTEDHEAAAQIIHSLRLTLNAATETTHSFHNIAVLLGRGSPLRYSYTILMGWIHELTYQITSINVQREQLTELLLPRLLTPSSQQDYFRNTLQLFNITEGLFRESLQYVFAVTAHAASMITVLQAYQMLQALHYRVTPHIEEDPDYTYLMQANTPETLDPGSYLEKLRWWRENYSDALMIHNTRGYLRTHEVNRMLQEQQGQQSATTAHTTIFTPSTSDPSPSSHGAINIRFRVFRSIRLGRIYNVCSAASCLPAVCTTPADAYDSDRWTPRSTKTTSPTATDKTYVAGPQVSRNRPS
ncbi:unnamed protein product [Heligmosomoides polygyrus]|uniref:TPR_REGION domain-containing protein n=1 Tax=Heligmosomoides polygyrus TaxID=6339 RepID=A0A183FWV5_HELPZ|nr:unnamed protein product [Heligmosomoides polygyrus]